MAAAFGAALVLSASPASAGVPSPDPKSFFFEGKGRACNGLLTASLKGDTQAGVLYRSECPDLI